MSSVSATSRSIDRRIDRDRKFVLLGVLVVWEIAFRMGLISQLFFASPSQIAVAAVDLAQDPLVRAAIGMTGRLFFVALGFAMVGGIVLGGLMGLSNILYRSLHPIFVMFFATPSMIFIPLVILALGTGDRAKIAYAVFGGLLPVTITVTAGTRSIDSKFIRAARSMGASRLQLIRHVLVPGALPAVFASVWYGIKHCLLGVLIMELFVSRFGIGYLLRSYSSSFRADRVLVLMLSVSLIAIALASLASRLETRVMHWQPRQ